MLAEFLLFIHTLASQYYSDQEISILKNPDQNNKMPDRFRWELRQLAGRLRDDMRQLENIMYRYSDQIISNDLIPIVVGYWSEEDSARRTE